MSSPLVVKVGTFAEFCDEIPAGRKVRVCSTESSRGGTNPFTTRELALHLQAINTDREIVWLCYRRTLQIAPGGEPWRDIDKDLDGAWPGLQELVEAYLISLPYAIRGGIYGISSDIQPLGGDLEFIRWDKEGAEFILVKDPE
jgi:hypothetical protein